MKKFVFLLVFSILTIVAYAQNPLYLISQGGTVTDCAGDFYDSGDGTGAYGANENFTITFNSSSSTITHIKMTFNNFDVDPGDTLICYDGPNTAAPVIGKYNNNNLPPNFVDASIYNVSGDLTFQFKSNGTLQNAGWFGSLVCIPQCQDIIAAFDSVACIPHPNDSNYIDICLGNTIKFAALGAGPGVFPQNNALYTQDSSTSLFIWDFGDGTSDTGRIVYHTYTLLRGYDIGLTIIDAQGCMNQNYLNGRVRISTDPIAQVHPVADLCSSADTTYMTLGYNINSVVVVEPIMAHQSSSQRYDSLTFIPDGPNCPPGTYNTEVTFTQFLPGQTITSSNDVLSICVDIEHSFAGDLGFSIICPNGQTVILDGNDHSGGSYLGNANDVDGTPACSPAANTPGSPWVYCWSQIYPQQGSLNVLDALTSPVPATDTLNNTGYLIPDASLSGLIGCPLNGTWNIQITDNWGIDNGYVFWWELNLDPALLPGGWSYQVPIDTVIWSGSFLSIIDDSTVMAVPTSSGSFPYTVTVIDAFGCSYDTTLYIQVVESSHPDLGPDTTLCGNGLQYLLDAGQGTTFNWSTGSHTSTQIVNTSGIYSVEVLNYNLDSTLTCFGYDTVKIIVYNQPFIDLGPDICSASDSAILLDAGYPGYQYIWNDGSTNQTMNVTQSGQYAVTISETIGNGCEDRDTISISINPATSLEIIATDVDGNDISSSNIEICSHKTVKLTVKDVAGYLDNPNYVYTYYWDTPLAKYYTRDISLTCLPEGANNIRAYVTGCIVTDTVQLITTKLCVLELPNVFTPNGDGVNDFFEIEGIEDFPNSTVQVFNRWGKKIFESENYNNSDNAWTGENSAAGVYYYVLKVNYGEKNTCLDAKDFSGTVTIMR
jgi:gliding motility-associated-like protein